MDRRADWYGFHKGGSGSGHRGHRGTMGRGGSLPGLGGDMPTSALRTVRYAAVKQAMCESFGLDSMGQRSFDASTEEKAVASGDLFVQKEGRFLEGIGYRKMGEGTNGHGTGQVYARETAHETIPGYKYRNEIVVFRRNAQEGDEGYRVIVMLNGSESGRWE